MKNKIIGVFIGVALFTSLGVSATNAQTFNSGAFLASVSQIVNSLSQILAAAVKAVPDEPKAKDIIQTIQVQTENLKILIEENRNIISQAAQEMSSTIKTIGHTLGLGAVGEDVKLVQKYLASQPDVYPEGLVTGYYGTLTQQAVQKFQQKVGLDPVGVVGPKTLEIINEELAESVNITVSPSFNLQEYTVALLNIVNDFKQAPAGRKNIVAVRLADYAGMRKKAVLETMKTNPKIVLENAVPAWAISQMPSDVLNLVEQRRQISGKFEWIHIDYDLAIGKSEDEFYIIENGTNKRYEINIEGEPQTLTDDTVTVDGVVLDDQIATTENLIQVISSANKGPVSADRSLLQKIADIFRLSSAEAQTPTTTPKKVAVIMFNWLDDTRTPWTADQAKGAYFTNSNSANAYYKENSFNKIELIGKYNIDGDVFGWITIPYNNDGCPYISAGNTADSILLESGVDLSGYNIKSYVFPSTSDCAWSGMGTVGGGTARSYMNGSIGASVVFHELGHNMGTNHAGSYSCTESGVRVSISQDSNCVLSEYGDPYTIMGSATSYHMHNYHKGIQLYSLNWLEPQNTFTINKDTAPDAIYAIAPIEQQTLSGVQSLRIPRAINEVGSIVDYYYLESRQPYGFDNFSASSPVASGVTIRIAPNYNATMKSKLIDTTPGTFSFSDAPLAVGKTFTDPYKSINITNLSVSPVGAQVRVSFGPVPCTPVNPSLTVSPTSQSLYAGQSASFSYTITNNDTSTCSSSIFSITPTLPAGFSQSPLSISHTLAGGASASGTFIITAASDASVSTYPITETVTNTSEPIYQSAVSLSITILSPDTTPPSVAITSPSDGAVISGKSNISISASASDESGIAQIDILFDGSVLKTCYNTISCSARKSGKSVSAGAHIISAQATDNGGPVANTASASVTVTKR